MRVLTYPKFALSPRDQEELLADYLPFCKTVRVSGKTKGLPACRDPFDLPFLALALAGKADALVTGDGDLLALARNFPIPIITAAECERDMGAKVDASGQDRLTRRREA